MHSDVGCWSPSCCATMPAHTGSSDVNLVFNLLLPSHPANPQTSGMTYSSSPLFHSDSTDHGTPEGGTSVWHPKTLEVTAVRRPLTPTLALLTQCSSNHGDPHGQRGPAQPSAIFHRGPGQGVSTKASTRRSLENGACLHSGYVGGWWDDVLC